MFNTINLHLYSSVIHSFHAWEAEPQEMFHGLIWARAQELQ